MKNLMSPKLTCRYCLHYSHEGRRGGQCQRLGAPVKGEWASCSLLVPCFAADKADKGGIQPMTVLESLETSLENTVESVPEIPVSELYPYPSPRSPLPKAG